MLTGDTNFTEPSWANMSSTKDYEELILDQFIENNLSNVAPSQLVFLCNNPEIVLNCTYDRSLFKNFSINNKPCSDLFPICTQINLLLDAPLIQANDKFTYNNTDWKDFNYNLTIDLFTPFCYSNVDFLLEQFYSGYATKYEKIYSLSLNIGFTTMDLKWNIPYDKLNTKNRVEKSNLSFKLNIKNLEVEVRKAIDNDLSVYEVGIFENRQFSKIQK